MKKRVLCIFLCVILCLACLPLPSFALEEAEQTEQSETVETLIRVRLKLSSNLTDRPFLIGLYKDNTFYASPEDVCLLGDGEIREGQSGDVIGFSFFSNQRQIGIDRDGQATEYFKNKTIRFQVPVVRYQGKTYLSILHLFRYLQIPITFAQDDTEAVHLYVSCPYTIYDAWAEYEASAGWHFSWGETEENMKLKLLSAGLDAALLHYDPKITHYLFNSGEAENAKVEDALFAVVTNEGADVLTQELAWDEGDTHGKKTPPLIVGLNTGLGLTDTWFSHVREIFSKESNLAIKLMDYSLKATAFQSDQEVAYINALEAAAQYGNITTAQAQVLEKTLLRYGEGSDFYNMYPRLFQIAKRVGKKIEGEYDIKAETAKSMNREAAFEVGKELVSSLLNAGVGGYSMLVVDLFESISVLIAVSEDPLVEREVSLAKAEICAEINTIAWEMEQEDSRNFLNNNMYAGSKDSEKALEQLKYDMVLSLKAGMTTRKLLLDYGIIKSGVKEKLERKIRSGAKLLNKVENAVVLPPGNTSFQTKEDLTWIANLEYFPMGNTNDNIANGGFAAYDGQTGEYYYRGESRRYSGYNGRHNAITDLYDIVRENTDGTTETVVAHNACNRPCINVINGYIYYIGGGPEGTEERLNAQDYIWRVRMDGTENQILIQQRSIKLYVTEEYIYFADENSLYRSELDGSDIMRVFESVECLDRIAIGNTIYASTYQMIGDVGSLSIVAENAHLEGIWAIDPDSLKAETIWQGNVIDFTLVGSLIYFTYYGNGESGLAYMSRDGSQMTMLMKDAWGSVFSDGNGKQLYLITGDGIYVIKLDNNSIMRWGDYDMPNWANDRIYSDGNGSVRYRTAP
ncbi:MAG: DUF5050 domain-containing protein [Lachnospiraceae bacterium]|nr:DUF5050 domain-containing protein [Lachnospiraceae bacterium]